MVEQRIQQHFIDSADLCYQWAQTLARPVMDALQALLACVTGGGKVLVCGNGASGALAQYTAALMIGGMERTRPELPCVALGADAAALTAVARRGELAEVFASQVRALGAPGDVLLLITSNGNTANLVRAAQAAHDRDMVVVALTGRGGGELGRMLRETDVHVGVPQESVARIHEAHQLVLHCLCDGLDVELLGEEESSE